MKKKKKMWSLIGQLICLLVLVGVLLLMQDKNRKTDSQEEQNDEIESNTILEWDEEKTRKISLYTNSREKITLIKENDTWTMEKYEKIPLIQEEVSTMIGYVSSLSSERTVEDIEDLSEFGLDDPVNVITIETEDGEVESLAIGAQNPSTGYTYIYLNDKKDVVYTVNKNLENLFKYDFLDFVESESYPSFSDEDVRKVEVIKAENSFTLLYDNSATTGWSVKDEAYGKKLADDDEGDNLASMVEVLNYSEFYEYECEDFAAYGLDDPQMEIRVTYLETVEVESEESEDDEEEETKTETVKREFVIYVGDLNADGYYYVRMDDSLQVHGIAQSHIDKLLEETAVDYWALNMSEISLKKLDYLEAEYDGKTYILRYEETEEVKEDDEEESTILTTYYVDDKKVDADAFETFYRNAIGIECQERMITCETQEDAELIFRFHGTDGEVVEVSYIPWDASFYAVINNGTDYGLVNKLNVKNLKELLVELVG